MTIISLKFLVCGVVSLGGDGLRGMEHSFAWGMSYITAGIYSYFTPLGNKAIKCWGVTYRLDHDIVEI